MDLNKFLREIEREFNDLKPGVLQSDDNYKIILQWNSLNAFIFVNKIQTMCSQQIDMEEILSCSTFKEVYERTIIQKIS